MVSTLVTTMPVSTSAIHDIRYSDWRDHQAGRQNLTAPQVLQQDDDAVVRVSSQMESLFPQLDITLAPPSHVNNNTTTVSRVPLHPNSFEPTYFESSLFEGKVLLVFPHKDEYELQRQQENHDDDTNEKKQTKYIDIQIQGKFKRVPKGTIYFGVQFDTYIGGWKKWIAKMIFKLIQAFAPIKFSYGNEKNNELPYVTSPLEYNAETYIATPPTEIPPPLGRSLIREKNIETTSDGNRDGSSTFNTIDTYTFRFSNPCFDLVEWQFSLGDYKINLEDMLGTSNVNLIAYEHDDGATASSSSSSSDDDYYHMFFATVQPYHERVIQTTTK